MDRFLFIRTGRLHVCNLSALRHFLTEFWDGLTLLLTRRPRQRNLGAQLVQYQKALIGISGPLKFYLNRWFTFTNLSCTCRRGPISSKWELHDLNECLKVALMTKRLLPVQTLRLPEVFGYD